MGDSRPCLWLVPARESGLLWVGTALAAALVAPLAVLIWLPLWLGVPHVLADLRYLLSSGSPAPVRLPIASVACLGLLIAQRVLAVAGGPFDSRLELGLGIGALATALWARAPGGTPLLAARVGVVAAGGALLTWPLQSLAVLAHLHNLTAVVFWTRFRPARTRGIGLALAGYATALALIFVGAADGAFAALAQDARGIELVGPLAPGLAGAWPWRVLLSFAFGQAFHYAIWLDLVPQAAAPVAPAPGRGWLHDLGTVPALLGLTAAIAVPILGFFDPLRIRSLYLGLAGFHGWLEWTALARGFPESGADPA